MRLSPKVLFAASALALLMGVPTPSSAALIMTFDNGGTDGGSLAYGGSGGALVGTGIIFETIMTTDSPLNDGELLTLTNGRLNFVTGDNISEGPNEWKFAGGGSFTITATEVRDSSNTLITGGTLLTGEFKGEVTVISGLTQLIVSGFGVDDKNTALLDFYGIPHNVFFSYATTQISTSSASINSTTGAFSGVVGDADVINSVPEPGSAFLVLSSAVSFAGLGLRRCRRKSQLAA